VASNSSSDGKAHHGGGDDDGSSGGGIVNSKITHPLLTACSSINKTSILDRCGLGT